MTKYLLAVLLTVLTTQVLTFSAKPMAQGFQLLEQTAEYIAAEGPAFIAGAGAVLAYSDDRADGFFPEPELDQVSHNSNGIETDGLGHAALKVLGEVRDFDYRTDNRKPGCIIS